MFEALLIIAWYFNHPVKVDTQYPVYQVYAALTAGKARPKQLNQAEMCFDSPGLLGAIILLEPLTLHQINPAITQTLKLILEELQKIIATNFDNYSHN